MNIMKRGSVQSRLSESVSYGFRPREHQLLPLINIIMLLLVFFLMMGRIEPRAPSGLELVRAQGAAEIRLSDAPLSLTRDGVWRVGEVVVDSVGLATYVLASPSGAPLDVLVDQNLPATQLTTRLQALAALGVARVRLITNPQANGTR